MKKILAKIIAFCLLAQVYLYGAFGDKLVNTIKSEVTSTGDLVMAVFHLASGVVGGFMIIFIAFCIMFKSEMIKDHLKAIIIISIITGVIWGATDNGVSVFQ
ncbi:Uncharacterised protein [Helicobacter fennelliae]|uniref:Uncharacterized protein n=1 Tax=Helicobacter fennelliae TaxID=215 RepID=A0A2X3EFE6_9HELI|nr:hypothetical protein [Helicobacter fennelliae]SQC36316.1 Uncharacterised protein [Helicobacter fennelliae]